MSTLQHWIIHRAGIVKLAWPQGVADAAGVATSALDAIAEAGSLRPISRSARGYIARALKVSVRELEALAAGRIAWIADERKIDLDRISRTTPQITDAVVPQAYICRAGLGVPILGRVLPTGKVEHFDDWTAEDGARLPVRYTGLPDAFALELTISIASYFAGECLVFQAIPPGEIRDGELVLLTQSAWDAEPGLFFVNRSAVDAFCTVVDLVGPREARMIPLEEILRAGRVVGSWKRPGVVTLVTMSASRGTSENE